jgi:hypothetical protein
MRGREDRVWSFVLGQICKICSELLSWSLDKVRSTASMGDAFFGAIGNEPRRTRSTGGPLLDPWDLY